ncbi:Arc family DNA-binding protein [Thermobispora bispora]|uniref:Arc family DNA-binding protein n=1 Tax=Thermobispora bispora TaxID=2006 RepID=UPI0011D18469
MRGSGRLRRGRGKPGPAPKWGEPLVRFPSRLPEGMRARLEAEARRLGWSVNDVLVARLAEAMGYDLPPLDAPPGGKAGEQEPLPLLDGAHVAA